jgi:hypothetical protein
LSPRESHDDLESVGIWGGFISFTGKYHSLCKRLQGYKFTKRRIYNTPFYKYWIVRHGERLPSPPEEVNAHECTGPAVFVNVPPSGDRQIWLWNTNHKTWDTVRIKHIVDLDIKRELSLSPKNVPVFPRAGAEKGTEKGNGGGPRFVRYIPPQSQS